jgi:hypothetical protein
MTLNWTELLATQLDWPWQNHLRPRLAGLTDEEYFWEPVPHTWSVRPRGHGVATEVGQGQFIVDFSLPEPSPPPVTTIAWRLAHLLVGVLGTRSARYFGGPDTDFDSYDYPGSAHEALARLDDSYLRWITGVRGLDEAALAAPCREPGFESDPMGALVLHINREMLHHLAEVALLRDLYLWRDQSAPLSRG